MPVSKDSNSHGKLSRRQALKLGAGALAATGFTFLQRRADRLPLPLTQFFNQTSLEQIAEHDEALRVPLLVDAQTHVWWRAGGVRRMTPRGEAFLRGIAGSRASVTGQPVHIADMGRVMYIEDVFLHSETDIAFLNSFGMRAAFDGVDLFPPREAALIRSLAPSRIRVLGTVDPPDGQSAVESLIYQCETIKIDGLKLYPPGADTRGWRMDDEKNTYPLYEVMRKHGVKNICVHKGFPGTFIEEYCHTADLVRAAQDFPDLNFIAFHSAYPFDAELAEQVKRTGVRNVYAEMGGLAAILRSNPARFAQLMGTLLNALGTDHILWGTDAPVIGSPHWQIQAFQAFNIPDQLVEREKYPQLTPELKQKIFGLNAARLFGIDIKAARLSIEQDTLYKLREDGNALPNTTDADSLRAP